MTFPPPHETSTWLPTCPAHLARAVGGVVLDRERGLVLMREAAGHYGGTAWTPLAKGAPEPGETDEECALREVLEEMGAVVALVAALDGWWIGSTSAACVYVAELASPLGRHGAETSAVTWVDRARAHELIDSSPSAVVRDRDHAVLDAVFDRVAQVGRSLAP